MIRPSIPSIHPRDATPTAADDDARDARARRRPRACDAG